MKSIIATSFVLGTISGLLLRDEVNFPTNMRIKVAILEHHMLIREKVNTDLIDIVDSNTSKELTRRSKEFIEAHND
jgi:hypothetical protein